MVGAVRMKGPTDFAARKPVGIIAQHHMKKGRAAVRCPADKDYFFSVVHRYANNSYSSKKDIQAVPAKAAFSS